MTMQLIRKAMRYGSAALILAGLLGAASLVSQTTTTTPKKPAVAAKPAVKAPVKPATNTGGAKTPTTTVPKPSTVKPPVKPNTPKPPRPVPVPTPHPNPKLTVFKNPPPRGSHDRVASDGSTIRTRGNGKVSDIHDAKSGMDVRHNLRGGRVVSHELPDHGRIVSEQGRRGYVQRGYPFHGHDFGRRSYYYNGRSYDRFYRGYPYRGGLYLNVYAPGFYYNRGFYSWAYNPWAAPIAFGWGWGGAPWYGRYGYYFQPYPVYPSAAFWLTDYIISSDLQAAYAARQPGENDGTPVAAGGQPVLTPEVKQMIADEVKSQLALENQEAAQNTQGQDADPRSSSIDRLLSDGHPHVFVAGGNLDVTDASSGTECAISDGDALQLQTPPDAKATQANLVVLSSKGTPECRIALTVQVQLTDLQEMQNHMRETIDQGLQDLQARQGTGGLPAAPASAQGQAVPAAYAAAAPAPDPNVGAQIQQQDQQGEQAEKDALLRLIVLRVFACLGGGQFRRLAPPRQIRLRLPPLNWARPPTRCRRLWVRRQV
jgi:hypothetical protein